MSITFPPVVLSAVSLQYFLQQSSENSVRGRHAQDAVSQTSLGGTRHPEMLQAATTKDEVYVAECTCGLFDSTTMATSFVPRFFGTK